VEAVKPFQVEVVGLDQGEDQKGQKGHSPGSRPHPQGQEEEEVAEKVQLGVQVAAQLRDLAPEAGELPVGVVQNGLHLQEEGGREVLAHEDQKGGQEDQKGVEEDQVVGPHRGGKKRPHHQVGQGAEEDDVEELVDRPGLGPGHHG
jgi:hypothetical protein